MGNQNTVVNGPDDIVLLQIPPEGCDAFNFAPRWQFASPTPLLQQRGLNAQLLAQELNTIQSVCKQRYDAGPNVMRICAYSVLSFILLFCVSFVMAFLIDILISLILVVLISFGMVGMYGWWMCSISRKLQGVVDVLKQRVDVELNGKYENSGIRWALQEAREGRNTYYHIVVSCVDVPQQAQVPSAVQGYHQQQKPTVLYVDQNGNPIHAQQVQVVVLDDQGNMTYLPDDQPVEALPAYEGTSQQV
mmetsp:Transcript_10718/g.17266  ORF Transcript_10718/g.17266 Transcript_10718/m.17266 type:complete len:247 (+) Transcript_10718:75-815(+)|eukprot:CAMPEP_0197036324 /NCGR_PEP_ID=MMETSP1384-20130603/13867_1 /TAXON_ID=29189 /ORGANISM="Ammonia sp." /LENGTH=246 /DNA_ID=CAMNT_0042466495 /DNA_START=63 /DNA_END=803 /DNA_ORIENTATION=+